MTWDHFCALQRILGQIEGAVFGLEGHPGQSFLLDCLEALSSSIESLRPEGGGPNE